MTLSSFCLAQTPEMLDTTWYLHKLLIDEVDNTPPTNSDNISVTADFNFNDFETVVCAGATGSLSDFSDTNFTINDLFISTIDCINPESSSFESQYYGTFYLAAFNDKQFDYEIVNGTVSPRTLIITNENGDKAFYGNTILDINSFELSEVSLYPNPVKNELYLKTTTIIERLEIYSITGELVKQESTLINASKINVENLVSGVYFLKLMTDEGVISTHKIIKE